MNALDPLRDAFRRPEIISLVTDAVAASTGVNICPDGVYPVAAQVIDRAMQDPLRQVSLDIVLHQTVQTIADDVMRYVNETKLYQQLQRQHLSHYIDVLADFKGIKVSTRESLLDYHVL